MSDVRNLNIPIPDPSLLTTEQLRRELFSLRELLTSEMGRIEKVNDEKFRGLEMRFLENKNESKNALDAALRAVTDANDKSEKNFAKQIEANEIQTKTITGALNSQVSDVKERITSLEAGQKGAGDITSKLMAVVTLVILLGMAIFTVTTRGGQPSTILAPAISAQPNGK